MFKTERLIILLLLIIPREVLGGSDYLPFVLKSDLLHASKRDRRQMEFYRAFINEGNELSQQCSYRKKPQFPSSWKENLAQINMVANLQAWGLKTVIPALGAYANYFDFKDEEFENFSNQLVGNFCSKNLSILSLKTLKTILKKNFESKDLSSLPRLEGNSLFPKNISTLLPVHTGREKEFIYTIKLFQNLCSWGGDLKNLRLMVPLLRSPLVMSEVIRSMSSTALNGMNSLGNVS